MIGLRSDGSELDLISSIANAELCNLQAPLNVRVEICVGASMELRSIPVSKLNLKIYYVSPTLLSKRLKGAGKGVAPCRPAPEQEKSNLTGMSKYRVVPLLLNRIEPPTLLLPPSTINKRNRTGRSCRGKLDALLDGLLFS